MKKSSKPILKVIANWRYGEKPGEAKLEFEDIPREELDNNSWWYFHGDLEKRIGYDKGWAVNCKTLGISKWNEHYEDWEMHFTGEILVQVDGIQERCIGYFWTTQRETDEGWRQRGLVCLMSDRGGREYAKRRYHERVKGL